MPSKPPGCRSRRCRGERGERADDVGSVDGRSRRTRPVAAGREHRLRGRHLPDHGSETYHGHDGIRLARAIEPFEDAENVVEDWTRESRWFPATAFGDVVRRARSSRVPLRLLAVRAGARSSTSSRIAIPAKPSQPPGCRSRRGVQSEQSLVASKGARRGAGGPPRASVTRSSARRSAPSLVKIGKLEA